MDILKETNLMNSGETTYMSRTINPKVMIITMGLSRIVKPIVSKHNVVGIIECAPRNSKKTNNSAILKILKYCYRFVKKENETLETYTLSKTIPYYYMDKGSDASLEKWVKDINPDIIVVYSMSQLLKENIFNIPKYKTINLHPSFLPKYRGPFPDFWMYYNMEKKGGVTVHFVDEGEDTGDIIYQDEYNIPFGMKSPDMMNIAIGEIGVRLLLKALNNIENLPRLAQPEKSPTDRARNIKKDEHKEIIEWDNWKIEKVWHLLNGTELWLDAFEQPKGIYSGQRWEIKEFEKCDTSQYDISKVYKEKGRHFVICRDGKIYLSIKFSFKKFILNILR